MLRGRIGVDFFKQTRKSGAEGEKELELFGARRVSGKENSFIYEFRLPWDDAKRIELVGDFNETESTVLREKRKGLWEIIYESDIPLEGMRYGYKIFSDKGIAFVSDPFARRFDVGDDAPSILIGEEELERKSKNVYAAAPDEPVNICRVDMSSLSDAVNDAPLNYREWASVLSKRLGAMKYTHIELHNVMGRGIFAPDPTHGTPEDLKLFIDEIHMIRKGVILDFDFKKALREYPTKDLELKKNMFRSALLFWLEDYKIDGIKIDLDDIGLIFDTIGLGELLNKTAKKIKFSFPNISLIAEDPLGVGILTDSEKYSGRGFDYKLNRGWQRDITDYIEADPIRRRCLYSKLTFSLRHAFFERFILPLDKENFKIYEFEDIKLLLGAMITHPGKKMTDDLNDILDSDIKMNYLIDLNKFYLEHPQLWELDREEAGFAWACKDGGDDCVIAYYRFSHSGSSLLCVFNFSEDDRDNYVIRVEDAAYREAFNSDAKRFGGKGRSNGEFVETSERGDIKLRLPPLSWIALEPIEKDEKNK